MDNKKEIISIPGMAEKFGVSIMTIYRNYVPSLKPVAVSKRKKYFSYEEAKALHESFKSQLSKFNVVA